MTLSVCLSVCLSLSLYLSLSLSLSLSLFLSLSLSLPEKDDADYQAIYDWILSNGLNLRDILSASQTTEKLESIKNLLMSVEKMIEVLQEEQVSHDLYLVVCAYVSMHVMQFNP